MGVTFSFHVFQFDVLIHINVCGTISDNYFKDTADKRTAQLTSVTVPPSPLLVELLLKSIGVQHAY